MITYPIKGLSGHPLESVTLYAARGFPLDRAFAFARHDSGMDAAAPRPMPKSKFLVLARERYSGIHAEANARDAKTNLTTAMVGFGVSMLAQLLLVLSLLAYGGLSLVQV